MNTHAAGAIAIVVPSFNDSGSAGPFVRQLLAFLGPIAVREGRSFAVVVVDDGSRQPLSASALAATCGSFGPLGGGPVELYLLRHIINLGQGAALRTGISFALDKLGADYFVTMDSDGQHRLEDLMGLLNPVLTGRVDVAFGNRFAGQLSPNMPSSRKMLLRCATLFERVITGLPLGDAHNGYRAFNAHVAADLKIRQNRMAHATEIKQIVARKKYRFTEVPVSIDYSEESLQKGQRNSGSLAILKDLMRAYLFSG